MKFGVPTFAVADHEDRIVRLYDDRGDEAGWCIWGGHNSAMGLERFLRSNFETLESVVVLRPTNQDRQTP